MTDHHEVRQDSMIVVKKKDGTTFFWDGIDLKKRITFSSIGLDLCLTPEQIEDDFAVPFFPKSLRLICAKPLFSMQKP